MTPTEAVAIIMAAVALGGLAVQWWTGRSTKRKDEASASESIAEAVTTLLTPLRERIAQLETQTKEQSQQIEMLTKTTKEQQFEITELRAGVMLLTNQIVGLGHTPIYVPSQRK